MAKYLHLGFLIVYSNRREFPGSERVDSLMDVFKKTLKRKVFEVYRLRLDLENTEQAKQITFKQTNCRRCNTFILCAEGTCENCLKI